MEKFTITCKSCGSNNCDVTSYDHSTEGYGIVVVECNSCGERQEFTGAADFTL